MSRSTRRFIDIPLLKALADIFDCRVREPPEMPPTPDDNTGAPVNGHDNAEPPRSLLKLLSSLGKYPWPH